MIKPFTTKKQMKYRQMILKIQRPLATNETVPMALIYNHDRSVEAYIPYDKELAEVFGEAQKMYWLCNVPLGRGYIKMVREVEWQDW